MMPVQCSDYCADNRADARTEERPHTGTILPVARRATEPPRVFRRLFYLSATNSA